MSGKCLLGLLACAAVVLVCGQVIRTRAPAVALLLSISGLLVLTGMLLPGLQTLRHTMNSLLTQTGLESHLFVPLFKVLAITQITRISAELCRDGGERGLAAKLELCGAVASLICVLPLAQEALTLVGALGT